MWVRTRRSAFSLPIVRPLLARYRYLLLRQRLDDGCVGLLYESPSGRSPFHRRVCRSSVLERAITELFGTDRQAFVALQETQLAARIVEAVVSRQPVTLQVPTARQYVRH